MICPECGSDDWEECYDNDSPTGFCYYCKGYDCDYEHIPEYENNSPCSHYMDPDIYGVLNSPRGIE